jgi:hypothetical protein
VLISGSSVPQCVHRDCENGKVPFEDGCHELNKAEACVKYSEYIPGYVFKLQLNPNNNQLACVNESYKIFCVDDDCKFTGRKAIQKKN